MEYASFPVRKALITLKPMRCSSVCIDLFLTGEAIVSR